MPCEALLQSLRHLCLLSPYYPRTLGYRPFYCLIDRKPDSSVYCAYQRIQFGLWYWTLVLSWRHIWDYHWILRSLLWLKLGGRLSFIWQLSFLSLGLLSSNFLPDPHRIEHLLYLETLRTKYCQKPQFLFTRNNYYHCREATEDSQGLHSSSIGFGN